MWLCSKEQHRFWGDSVGKCFWTKQSGGVLLPPSLKNSFNDSLEGTISFKGPDAHGALNCLHIPFSTASTSISWAPTVCLSLHEAWRRLNSAWWRQPVPGGAYSSCCCLLQEQAWCCLAFTLNSSQQIDSKEEPANLCPTTFSGTQVNPTHYYHFHLLSADYVPHVILSILHTFSHLLLPPKIFWQLCPLIRPFYRWNSWWRC